MISFPQRFLTHVTPLPSTLLANDLFLPWDLDPRDLDPPGRRLRAYTEDRELAGQVLERLLFYDRVVVPTVDFSIVVPLVHWIGVPLLRELLVSEALSFVRFKGTLGYAGNGRGLVLFERHPQNRLTGLAASLVEILGKLVDICTVHSALPKFKRKVEEETYRDILGSELLAAYFSIRNKNLKSLENLGPDKLRVFSSLAKPAVVDEAYLPGCSAETVSHAGARED